MTVWHRYMFYLMYYDFSYSLQAYMPRYFYLSWQYFNHFSQNFAVQFCVAFSLILYRFSFVTKRKKKQNYRLVQFYSNVSDYLRWNGFRCPKSILKKSKECEIASTGEIFINRDTWVFILYHHKTIQYNFAPSWCFFNFCKTIKHFC